MSKRYDAMYNYIMFNKYLPDSLLNVFNRKEIIELLYQSKNVQSFMQDILTFSELGNCKCLAKGTDRCMLNFHCDTKYREIKLDFKDFFSSHEKELNDLFDIDDYSRDEDYEYDRKHDWYLEPF